uniref:Uncharacterized protein n=1 Tax=Meloidogyne hapla TaxID=6305 RepID=A0A1I8B5T7_MELHA
MERFLPYTHFGNNQHTPTQHGQSQRIEDGRSDNETIVDSNTANEQKLSVRGEHNQSMSLQMANNPHNIFGGNGQTAGAVYDETFMQARSAAALAEMETKIAAQSSVFASGMLMPPQVDNSFGHHSTMESGNNSNSAFQAEMAALCQQQMLQAQMLQATCFTPGIQHYNNSVTSTTSNSVPNNIQSSSSMAHFQQNLNNSPFGLHNYYSHQQQQQAC